MEQRGQDAGRPQHDGQAEHDAGHDRRRRVSPHDPASLAAAALTLSMVAEAMTSSRTIPFSCSSLHARRSPHRPPQVS